MIEKAEITEHENRVEVKPNWLTYAHKLGEKPEGFSMGELIKDIEENGGFNNLLPSNVIVAATMRGMEIVLREELILRGFRHKKGIFKPKSYWEARYL